MNLILLFPKDFVEDSNRVRLSGRRLAHVREIHRAKIGDQLCVGLAGDRIGNGRVTRLDDTSLEMEVTLSEPPPLALPVDLILALPRPPVLKRTLIAATSMGVKKIVLMNAKRVERSFWSSKAMAEEALREQLILGLEQARDTTLPNLQLCPYFRPFVEDELPFRAKGHLRLVAHPGAAAPCPNSIEGPLSLVVGPEGGFIPYEIEKLEAAGFTPVGLGKRILRVETAVPALLSRIFS